MGKKRLPKNEWIRIRCTVLEKYKLRAYAERHNVTDAHIIREYIRRLPNKLLSENEEEVEKALSRNLKENQ